ncbi:MAG: hypothetical protein MNSN_10500 [Minisyncoccus archaeiphilus]|uniref:DUF805 domain-containing protein n=1 Tax=Minisyncoccus archaeiphilus TaxID=3238481 RepID=UPI002B13E904|nr:MAG: hypothetical protein MNSN_10500 [Candidatus Parcubacteria bacterium]
MNYYTECFKKYFDFEGRATQEEFWYFLIINMIILGILVFIEETFNIVLYSTLFVLAIVIPTFSAAIRRLHDVGHSGWSYSF